jgi:hypothetical protein
MTSCANASSIQTGEHDRARQPRHRRLRLHQRAVTGERGDLDAVAGADLGHQQRVLLEREGVEVADLAEQLPACMDHRLDQLVAELGGDPHPLLERLVSAADELHVHGDAEGGHGRRRYGAAAHLAITIGQW